MSGRTRRGQRGIMFAKTRSRDQAKRMLSNIICRTGTDSLVVMKVLMDKIKSFN